MRYKYVIFDVDGTLVDSGKALCASFVRVMEEETGQQVAPETYARYWGIPGIRAFHDFGITDPARIAAAIERWDRYFQEIQAWSPPFPGIEAVLEKLESRGHVLGVVTSKNGEELEADFAPNPIARYLPHRVTADDTALHKPNPEPLLEMLRRLGARKEECVYIGDTVFDAGCANAAGVEFALASWGLLFGEPEGLHAVSRLARPEDILGLVGPQKI